MTGQDGTGQSKRRELPRRRKLAIELLQARRMFAVDIADSRTAVSSATTNATAMTSVYDIDKNGAFEPLDALLVINCVDGGVANLAFYPKLDLNHDDIIDFDDAQEIIEALDVQAGNRLGILNYLPANPQAKAKSAASSATAWQDISFSSTGSAAVAALVGGDGTTTTSNTSTSTTTNTTSTTSNPTSTTSNPTSTTSNPTSTTSNPTSTTSTSCSCGTSQAESLIEGAITSSQPVQGSLYHHSEFVGYYENTFYATQSGWEKIDDWGGDQSPGVYFHPQWNVSITVPETTFVIAPEFGISVGAAEFALSVGIDNIPAGVTTTQIHDVAARTTPCVGYRAELWVEYVETGFFHDRYNYHVPNGQPWEREDRQVDDYFEAADWDHPFYPFTGTPEKWYTKQIRILVYATNYTNYTHSP